MQTQAHLFANAGLKTYLALFFADKASNTPRAMPRSAAKSTRCSDGRRNVMVCAGYQKKGIVFLNTNPHCDCQLSDAKLSAIGIGTMSALIEPLCFAM